MSTDTYLDALDEREIVPAVDHRTKPIYATDGPGDGRDWAAYFREVKASGNYAQNSDGDPEDEEPAEREIIIPGYDMTDEEIAALSARGTVAQTVKRLRAAGWEVRVRRSLVRVPAVLYLSDSEEKSEKPHMAGDVRFPEHELETYALLGVKRGPDGRVGLAVDATWTSKGGFQGATTFDPVLAKVWRSGVMKPRPQNEIEVEDGITPPLGLKQWLDIVASRSKKAKLKEEA